MIKSGNPDVPCWNPVLFRGPQTPRIFLFYKTGQAIASWRTMLTIFEDDGYSWPPSQEHIPGDRGGRTWYKAYPPPGKREGEFSYPAVISTETRLRLTYTYQRKTIAYRSTEL